MRLKAEKLEEYLSGVYKANVKVKRVFSLGGEEKAEDLKGFGYGVPYVIEFSVDGEPADDVSAMTINYIFYSL